MGGRQGWLNIPSGRTVGSLFASLGGGEASAESLLLKWKSGPCTQPGGGGGGCGSLAPPEQQHKGVGRFRMGERIRGEGDGGGGDTLQHTHCTSGCWKGRGQNPFWGNEGNPASPTRVTEALGVTAWLSRPVRSKFGKAGHLTRP